MFIKKHVYATKSEQKHNIKNYTENIEQFM